MACSRRCPVPLRLRQPSVRHRSTGRKKARSRYRTVRGGGRAPAAALPQPDLTTLFVPSRSRSDPSRSGSSTSRSPQSSRFPRTCRDEWRPQLAFPSSRSAARPRSGRIGGVDSSRRDTPAPHRRRSGHGRRCPGAAASTAESPLRMGEPGRRQAVLRHCRRRPRDRGPSLPQILGRARLAAAADRVLIGIVWRCALLVVCERKRRAAIRRQPTRSTPPRSRSSSSLLCRARALELIPSSVNFRASRRSLLRSRCCCRSARVDVHCRAGTFGGFATPAMALVRAETSRFRCSHT